MKNFFLRIALPSTFFTLTTVLTPLTAVAQQAQPESSKVTAGFYGFVRGDLFFDSRLNASSFERLFLLYPLDRRPDTDGADLNKVPGSSFFSFVSRAGVDVGGLRLFNAGLTAKIEADFAGFGSQFGSNRSLLRIRHAYIKMDWPRSALSIGQTWHPFFGPVQPDVLSLSVGAPFNPFSRTPQPRYDYRAGRFTLSGAAVYQFLFSSTGPEGKSHTYQSNAIMPELYAGATYSGGGLTAGAGLNYLTIKPRTQSQWNGNLYKVNERLGSLSLTAYAKYSAGLLSVGAKTVYGKNLGELTMLGGYGISAIDDHNGRQSYTNLTQSSNWLNITYGKKYMGSIFAGYTKNLGSDKALVPGSALYVDGAGVDYLYRLAGSFSFNVPHFKLGMEYEMTTAGYGDGAINYATGRYGSTHAVTNHRIAGVIMYMF